MNRKHLALTLSALLIPSSACVIESKLGGEDVSQSDVAEDDDPEPAVDEEFESTGAFEGESSGGDGEDAETGEDASSPDGEAPPEAPSCDDESVIVPSAVLDCDFAGGYEVTAARTGEEGSPQLWITGVYQTHSDHSAGIHPPGSGRVQFDLPGDNVLVVSSYEPVDWEIEVGPDAGLSRVIAVGYHEQTVLAPEGVIVETYSYDTGDDFECGYSLPGHGGGCEGEDLVAWAQAHTGLTMSGFDGCYDASQFHYLQCAE